MADEIIPAAQDVLTVQRKLRPSRQLSLRWRSWRRLRAGDIFAYLQLFPAGLGATRSLPTGTLAASG